MLYYVRHRAKLAEPLGSAARLCGRNGTWIDGKGRFMKQDEYPRPSCGDFERTFRRVIVPLLMCITVACSACNPARDEKGPAAGASFPLVEHNNRRQGHSPQSEREEPPLAPQNEGTSVAPQLAETPMPQLELVFCYDFGSLTGSVLAEIIERGIGFEPHYVTLRANDTSFNLRNRKWDSKVCLESIRAAAEVNGLELGIEPHGHDFHFVNRTDLRADVIFLKLPATQMPDRDVLDRWSSIPGFHAGYLADYRYTMWESERLLDSYESAGRPTEGLRIYGDAPILFVDISENPGRRSEFPGFFLQAAWRMWLGPAALAHLPVDRIRAYQQFEDFEQLDHGVLFCQLYADAHDADTRECRDLQRRFRVVSGMNQLESQASKLFADMADPVYEINHGKFEHGGTLQLVTWLDENDQPVARSKAARRFIAECDESGKRIWSGHVDR